MSFFTLHWRHLGVARAAPRRAPWERLGCSPWPWPGRCLALAWAVAWPWPGPGLGLALACPLPGLGLSFGLWRPVALLLWLGLWLPRQWGVWLGWLPDTHAKAKNVVDALALLSVTFARVRAAFRESLHTLVCVVVSVCVGVCFLSTTASGATIFFFLLCFRGRPSMERNNATLCFDPFFRQPRHIKT